MISALALSVILSLTFFSTNAQVKPNSKEVFTAVEQSAEFPGGLEKFYQYITANIKYPEAAKQNNVSGHVFLTFVVEKDGSLTDVKVMRGIGSGCDEEAVRVIKASPKWKPGTQNGIAVRQQYTVPISFGIPPKRIGKSTGTGENEVFTSVEQSAQFPGGITAFYDYLSKNMRYPDEARKANVQGKVFLTFVVEKDGSLTNVKVMRGIGSGCDEESVRVMQASPKWKPGQQNGKVVRQQYTVPISFSLSRY